MSGEDLNAMVRLGGQYAALGVAEYAAHSEACEQRWEITQEDECVCDEDPDDEGRVR